MSKVYDHHFEAWRAMEKLNDFYTARYGKKKGRQNMEATLKSMQSALRSGELTTPKDEDEE